MWKVVILSLAALLCTVQGSPYSRLNPKLWSQLVQMMQVENTKTGRCDNDVIECFVAVPGRDTVLLKPLESITVDDSCVEYHCTESSEVVEIPITCQEITNCDGEIIHYPNRCCPVCEGTNVNIECTLLEWGEWGECSRTCGGGRQVRVRSFTIPEGGDAVFCSESLTDIRDCSTDGCPRNCVWEWGAFGQCSRTCNGGTRRRDPNIIAPAANGGQPCPPPQVEDCGQVPCSAMCTLTECKINGVTRCIDPKDDPDDDCIPSVEDNCPDTFNPNQSNVDGDGIGDACDSCNSTPRSGPADQDGDGIEDTCDNCPKTHNPDQANTDDDDTGNMCDDDDDNDGEVDDDDNCQFVINRDQTDQDGDGHGDACDNCPMNRNSNQNDADGDGVGNVCDNCRFFKNPEQRSDDPGRFGDLCTTKAPGMVDVEDYEDYVKDDDKKGVVAEIMERLLELYYSN